MKKWKPNSKKTRRNITVLVVALCLGTATYLNWNYNHREDEYAAFADDQMASAKAAEEAKAQEDEYYSDYFAKARLTRQQSRDEAMALLETAAMAQTASKETIDGAMSTISVMAQNSMTETQIENLILAKDFEECMAFIGTEGITLAVPSGSDGLKPEDVAKITDAIIEETNFNVQDIKIIEVKEPEATKTSVEATEIPEDEKQIQEILMQEDYSGGEFID